MNNRKFRIQTMNKIAAEGLELFTDSMYELGPDIKNPDAIILRSADLHKFEIPGSVTAIARAGAGFNNIPVEKCGERGIVVFNTPGANANAVKELTLAALFLSSRKIIDSITWLLSFKDHADKDHADKDRADKNCADKNRNGGLDIPAIVEKEKNRFEGPELSGKTLGVIGLGAIGVMVANDAAALGMDVIGFDPYISVNAAWNLSRFVRNAESLEAVLRDSDYVSIHVPYSDKTKDMFNAGSIKMMKKGARLLNFARGGLAKEADVISALDSGHLSVYVTDFPTEELLGHDKVICIPHLGASTPEAEINCAINAAKQLKDFLENGVIENSVNFPRCQLARHSPYRLLVANRNIPNMVGQITTLLASGGINITDLINHHKDAYAYNIIDTEQEIPAAMLSALEEIPGIVRVRTI
ncbi:MAG: phosphoglycerate dehydrogenase [Spirochaetaceae bacterium]|jgi:D-3-phosphoglycerate dehydrogenase|nr:phosphoglycerate dehydrogenase [Spirochaetaceae bacterium]